MTGDVLIIGCGVEGRAACAYFLAHTDRTVLCTDENEDMRHEITRLGDQVRWVPTDKARAAMEGCDIVLRSPGIRPDHWLVAAALEQGQTVTTPTGYWLAHLAPKDTITVTGTKGKSTTVSILVHLLKSFGVKTETLGNIGHPALSENPVRAGTPVVELSSYMMHDLPDTGHYHLVTSLYREHTDWHGGEAAYRDAKLKPFQHQPPAPGASPTDLAETFGLPDSVQRIEEVVLRQGDRLFVGQSEFNPAEINLVFQSPGALHALHMALAAVLDRVPAATVEAGLADAVASYRGLAHRQNPVSSSDHRVWVDDALATVPEATLAALDRWGDKDITLILGGADRGQDFSRLGHYLHKRGGVRVILFGSIRSPALSTFMRHHVTCLAVGGFDEALTKAEEISPHGSIILFSPAAASEAPNGNYRNRARAFAERAMKASPNY